MDPGNIVLPLVFRQRPILKNRWEKRFFLLPDIETELGNKVFPQKQSIILDIPGLSLLRFRKAQEFELGR
jgi:hypothetical protein